MDEQSMVRRAGNMIETELDGELIGLEIDRGACFGFNATATRIWALIEQPRRVAELRAILLAEYDVDPAACARDLAELIERLERSGLVAIDPPRS